MTLCAEHRQFPLFSFLVTRSPVCHHCATEPHLNFLAGSEVQNLGDKASHVNGPPPDSICTPIMPSKAGGDRGRGRCHIGGKTDTLVQNVLGVLEFKYTFPDKIILSFKVWGGTNSMVYQMRKGIDKLHTGNHTVP